MHEKFILFGAMHWVIFAVTAAASVLAVWIVKKIPSSERGMNWVIAIFLAANKLATLYFAWNHSDLTLQNGLPLHLCDLTTLICIILLIWRKQLLYEIVYYWGLTGAIQAILTPDLTVKFSDSRFFTFFISHSGILVAVFYMTLGLGMRPSKFSVWKVFGITQIYTVATLMINHFIDTNYGYLCAKPQNPSLLDYLGPWPWYILSMEVLALFFFAICYLPFYFSKKEIGPVIESRKIG